MFKLKVEYYIKLLEVLAYKATGVLTARKPPLRTKIYYPGYEWLESDKLNPLKYPNLDLGEVQVRIRPQPPTFFRDRVGEYRLYAQFKTPPNNAVAVNDIMVIVTTPTHVIAYESINRSDVFAETARMEHKFLRLRTFMIEGEPVCFEQNKFLGVTVFKPKFKITAKRTALEEDYQIDTGEKTLCENTHTR